MRMTATLPPPPPTQPPTHPSFVHFEDLLETTMWLFIPFDWTSNGACSKSPYICFKVILKSTPLSFLCLYLEQIFPRESNNQTFSMWWCVCACVRVCVLACVCVCVCVCVCLRVSVLSQQVTLVRAWLRTSSSFAGWFFSTFSSPPCGSSSFFYLKSSTAATPTWTASPHSEKTPCGTATCKTQCLEE